jgi:hypothetical protein
MQVADLKANSVSRFFAAREAAPSVQDDLSSEPGIRTGSYGRRGVTSALPLSMTLEGKGGSREAASGVSIRDALSHNIRQCALTEGIYSDTHTLDALLAHAAHILQPPVRGRPHLPALSLIRVDAEGLDGAVVQGAMGVINSQNPVVIFEAEYQDGRNLSHFSTWERTMAEYPAHPPSAHCQTVTRTRRFSASKAQRAAPQLLLDMVADVRASQSTSRALRLLLCDAHAHYTCFPALCPVR